MRKKTGTFRFAALVSTITVVLMFATLLAAPAVGAAKALTITDGNIQYSGDKAAADSGISGGTDPDTPTPATSGVEIANYYFQINGQVPTKITKGTTFGLDLTIVDGREEAIKQATHNYVKALPNDSSFKLKNPDDNVYSNVPVNYKPSEKVLRYHLYFVLTYTGVGNTFQCDLSYMDQNGKPLDVPLASVSLTLNQCEETSTEGSVDVKGTGFVLKGANYGGKVEAGKNFTLSAEILSTNGATNVDNVTVGITPPEEITLADGSSIVYVGTVAPNQSIPVSFNLFPSANIEDGSYTVALDIKGINPLDGSEVAATASITIPVIQPERFSIYETQLPTYLTMGMDDGSGLGSVTLVNEGKGSVSNVSVEVVGEGITTDEGKQYIGHIAGGEQKSADFTLVASQPGQIEATVLVTYENVRGEQKKLEHKFQVTVEEGMPIDDSFIDIPEPIDEGGTGFPIWGWAIIVVVIVAGAIVAIVLVRRHSKAKKAAQEQADLEDDLEDDDETF